MVSDISSADFIHAMEIYLESFPENERQPLDKIKYRVQQGFYKLITAKRDKAMAGFSLLCPFRDLHFGLLDYMGVAKDHRNLGIGSRLFRKTCKSLKRDAPSDFLLLEVEDPACGAEAAKALRLRRVSFYERLGAVVVANFRYIMPPLAGNSPTDMLLMVYPASDQVSMTSEALADVVTAVYEKVYEKGTDDIYLCEMLQNLRRR